MNWFMKEIESLTSNWIIGKGLKCKHWFKNDMNQSFNQHKQKYHYQIKFINDYDLQKTFYWFIDDELNHSIQNNFNGIEMIMIILFISQILFKFIDIYN